MSVLYKKFSYKKCLDQYVANRHTHSFRKSMCDLCGAKYVTKWGLIRYCLSHNDPNNNPLLCRECGKGYSRNDLLQAHKRTHLPNTKCSHCEKKVFQIKCKILLFSEKETHLPMQTMHQKV